MPDETTYYRSEHPAVREWWESRQRAEEAYRAAVAELVSEHPGCKAMEQNFWGRWGIVGLSGPASPGPLWQQRAGSDIWTPTLRGKAGRELAARLKSISFQEKSPPGMPCEVLQLERNRAFMPIPRLLGDAVWVLWKVGAELVEADPAFDPLIWQRAKASEYHLAREAEGKPDA